MNRPDDEFEDFLKRRKPIFSRSAEEPLEPPDELDRLVLHQAREAVEGARPQHVFKGPRWGAPLAIAATLVLALTVILQVGMPAKPKAIPEVTVQTVSQRLDYPPAPAANNPARTGGFVAEGEAGRYASSDAAAPAAASVAEEPAAGAPTQIADVSPPPSDAHRAVAKATPAPVFRADSQTWLAEIERLRAAGKSTQAEAEYAEYKRQHRAYAVSPDR
jgi:hypothetical protein